MTEEGVRHIFLEVGTTTVLHPFQILERPPLPPAPGTMFRRGRRPQQLPGQLARPGAEYSSAPRSAGWPPAAPSAATSGDALTPAGRTPVRGKPH